MFRLLQGGQMGKAELRGGEIHVEIPAWAPVGEYEVLALDSKDATLAAWSQLGQRNKGIATSTNGIVAFYTVEGNLCDRVALSASKVWSDTERSARSVWHCGEGEKGGTHEEGV